MVVALMAFGWMLNVPATEAALDVPQLITYQARITDANRITVDDGALNFKFAIYDAASAGNCLWSADDTDATSTTIDCASDTPDGSISLTASDGIISVELGDTTANEQNALPDALFDDNATLFLGVTIGADAEMTPRKRITSAPYALQAGDSDLLDSLDTDNDGCTAACVPVTDANGNIVFTGDPQGNAVSQGVMYINPASADADEIVFGLAVGGVSRFTIDEDGDTTVVGALSVNGNTTLGDAATDTVTFTADVASNILPDQDDTHTLGASASRWADLYLGPNSLHIGTDGDEGIIGFDTTSNYIEFDTNGDATEEARFEQNGATQGVLHLYDGTSAYSTLVGDLYNSTAAISTPGVFNAQNAGVFSNNGLTLALTRNTDPVVYINDTTFASGDIGANADETGLLNIISSAARTTTGTYEFSGEKFDVTYTGTGANSTVFGSDVLLNVDPSSQLDAAYGAYYEAEMNGAGTATVGYALYGLYEQVNASGTTASAYGVYGESLETAGTITTGYGGYFKSTGAGTNYAIYADAGYVHIEGDGSPASPGDAGATGTLFVNGITEIDDTLYLDKTSTATSAAAEEALNIDMIDTGIVSSGNDLTYGIDIAATRTGASGGTILTTGVRSRVTGDTGGTSSTYAFYADAQSADANYAFYSENGYVHIEGDGSPTAPDSAGDDGSLFVKSVLEVDNTIVADYTTAGTTAATEPGITLGVTDTGNVSTGTDLTYGIKSSVQRTGASGGTISSFGGHFSVQGDAGGTSSAVGVYADAYSADSNYSIYTERGLVMIDGDTTPDTPDTATGSGQLFVANGVEIDNTLDIDYTSTASSAGTENGATITVADSGSVGSGTDTTFGLDIAVTRDQATAGTFDTYGVRSVTIGAAEGTSTAYGLFTSAVSADTNYAIFTNGGAVHLDAGGGTTTPTLNDVATDTSGTLFVAGDTEIYDGSLCVGDGVTDDCSDAAGTDGVIYSTAASVTQHDLAEMFPSTELLLAGEIVSVSADDNEHVGRTSQGEIIVGAISTSPGLILGWGGENQYAVALTGRTPIKVTTENGPIAIGDRIATGSTPGMGMLATEAGEVVGIAMEAYSGAGEGSVMAFIQPHYWDGVDVESVTQQAPAPTVQPDTSPVVIGNTITNIARIDGLVWSVDESGFFETEGAYTASIKSHQNTNVTTAAVLGMEHYITLAGTTQMESGLAIVEFEHVAPEFNDIISAETNIIVTATMSDGSGDVYVTDKSSNGFTLNRNGSGSGTEVDWIVMAYRRGLEPEEELEIPTDDSDVEVVVEEEEPDSEPEVQEEEDPVDEPELEDEAIEEELEEEPLAEDPEPNPEVIEEETEIVEEEVVPEPEEEPVVIEEIVEPEPEVIEEPEPAPEPEEETDTQETP